MLQIIVKIHVIIPDDHGVVHVNTIGSHSTSNTLMYLHLSSTRTLTETTSPPLDSLYSPEAKRNSPSKPVHCANRCACACNIANLVYGLASMTIILIVHCDVPCRSRFCHSETPPAPRILQTSTSLSAPRVRVDPIVRSLTKGGVRI